ncbi:MAG: hypothetical protein COB60_12790 [Flavobacteriaceae bacterium]|nr:MAG: hypothetical protein COB60_12790 [Flavobacteriaceae bacterium]
MATYKINFSNETKDTWTLCVYQELPDSPGLDSVSWKQTTVPQSGFSGVKWNIEYLAGIADYQQEGGKGVYTASQKLDTNLGQKWKCLFKDSVQQLFEDGSTTEGQLLIENESERLANLAIGMDGDIALVKSDVYSGNNAQFTVKPKYYVALFTDLVQGEIISGNQIHGPLEIVFDGGQTEKSYVAKIEGATFIFEEVGTSNRVEASYAQVEDRIRSINYRRRVLA